MKYALILLLLFSFAVPRNAEAFGLASAARGGVVGYVVYLGITQAVKRGGPLAISMAAKQAKKFAQKNPDKVAVLVTAVVHFAIENVLLTQKTLDLLDKAGLIDYLDDFGYSERQIIEDSKQYATAYAALNTSVMDVNEDEYCR